jgi:hypothetical protein
MAGSTMRRINGWLHWFVIGVLAVVVCLQHVQHNRLAKDFKAWMQLVEAMGESQTANDAVVAKLVEWELRRGAP